MHSESPIGVFDSGIGGLTVASAIAQQLPNESIFYFGDTARCPYGDKDPDEVIRYSCQIVDFLVEQGVKMVVVACNTATAVALPTLIQRYDLPVVGVVGPGARAAVRGATAHRIGVIGTAVTVRAGAYEHAIHQLDGNAEIFSLACPQFVPLVEQGLTEGPVIEDVVTSALAPLLACDVQALILGCTHYPLLQPVIQRVMGPQVKLISSAAETAREVADLLYRHDAARSAASQPVYRYFTTGDGAVMAFVANRWQLGLPGDIRDISEISVLALSNAQGA